MNGIKPFVMQSMNRLNEWSLELIRWLQAYYPQWLEGMRIISQLGHFELYLAIVPLIYWCFDKRIGRSLIQVLTISALSNSILKHWVAWPRPYWVDPTVSLSQEASYGLPSGHVQTITVMVLFWTARMGRNGWFWFVTFSSIFLMGLSRIYLGVHFVHDIWAGLLLGILIVTLSEVWQRYANRWVRARFFGQRLLGAVVIPLTVLVLYIAVRQLRGQPQGEVWQSFVVAADRAGWESAISAIALWLGLNIGFTIEMNAISFIVGGVWWKRLLRYLVGVGGALIVWQGLGILFRMIAPDDLLWLALPLRFIRHLLLGLWISYYGPYLFIKLQLAEASTEPELPFTVAGLIVKKQKTP